MLEEINFEYKVTKVDINNEEQFKEEFKKISPFSKVPVIIDHKNSKTIFESGAILIKNFLYPHDETDPESGYRLIETRLLINEDGTWKPLNYTWNEAQTDAQLNYVGKTQAVQWTNGAGDVKKVNYVVPNINQCKNCHSVDNNISPIGVTAAQLNQRYRAVKEEINQLIPSGRKL